MDKPTLMVPTVHVNGTSFTNLYDPMKRAEAAIAEAMSSLAECSPHGRDYYPQGDKAFEQAREQHLSRVSRLNSVLGELKQISSQVRKSRR